MLHSLEKEVYQQKPSDFTPKLHIVATYVQVQEQLLLLQLGPTKLEGGKWGVPAGKIEEGETAKEGALRELFEETGIALSSHDSLSFLGELYIRSKEYDYLFSFFSLTLPTLPKIQLSFEHSSYLWATQSEAEKLPFMAAGKEALDAYYRSIKKGKKGASVNVYLVLKKGNEVLFHLRKNTGYCDHYYGLVSGHIEEGESAKAALVREVYEEANLSLALEDLYLTHVMHRQTNQANIDLFFTCDKWQGEIVNKEPHKCADLSFFPLDALPSNVIDYIKEALEEISKKSLYSEKGWI